MKAGAGAPIALWPRKECPNLEECWQDVSNELLSQPLGKLASQVRAKRLEAFEDCEEDEDHWGKHIGLVWENYQLRPPLAGRLGMPT
ncbi:MAG: vWA-MoxR associated protein C-terminal domain [Cyanobacteriota bacterium]